MTVSTIGTVNKDIKREIKFCGQSFLYFETPWCFTKIFFDHEGNDVRLLLIVASWVAKRLQLGS